MATAEGDNSAALDTVNDLYQLFVPMAQAAVRACQDGSVGTLEGLALGARAIQLASSVSALVEGVASGDLPAVLKLLGDSVVLEV